MPPLYPRLLTNEENPLPAAEWWERADGGEVQFAYWVPNVSGGLVVTTLPMETGWDVGANIRYAKVAEEVGFTNALSQTRWFASVLPRPPVCGVAFPEYGFAHRAVRLRGRPH